jgi:PAS domain S-box-containing protein
MSWTTIIWSMAAAGCLTFAAMHFVVWLRQRDQWENVVFTIAAVAAAATALLELGMMHAQSPASYAEIMRWAHVAVAGVIISLVWFIRLTMRAGRLWLAWLITGLRVLVLVPNFVFYPNASFQEITALRHVVFLDETFAIPIGELNPWRFLIQLSVLLLLAFVLDAVITAWKQGQHRRSLMLGGATLLTIVIGVTFSGLMVRGIVPSAFIGLAFLLIVLAMAFELSLDLIRARQLARELQESEQRMSLAVEAADLGLWEWDIQQDKVWSTGASDEGTGISGRVNLETYLEVVHPDDRERTREAIIRALNGSGDLQVEFRAMSQNAGSRWIAVRGQVEYGLNKKPLRVRGVSQDITERKKTEKEVQELRLEMAQFNRIMQMNELSSSLAHEINQPLGIILSNAQAAQEYLSHDPPNLSEASEILVDIVAADRRAADTIQRMRELYKRGEISFKPLQLNEVIEEMLKLVQTDFVSRNVMVDCQFAEQMPLVTGDRIQLLQVLLNLILNAADAMADNAPGTRRIDISTQVNQDTVRVAVRDEGPGLSENVEALFEPFYTTKPQGLGMGLAICRSIIEAHGGRLWAENHPDKGAVFCFELRISRPQESS